MKKNKLLILYFIFIIPAVWALLRLGYISMHDDLQVMRLYEMEKCFRDGQIPCRWVPDMGAGYGFPLFNFYSPLPYYFGMVFRLFGLSYIWSVKLLFVIALVMSGYFMYLLVKEFTGKFGGLVAGVLYVYVPYHAVQVYVRGALGESWGMLFAPLLLWATYKYLKESKVSHFVISIVALAGVLTSHNIISMVFIPFAFVWSIAWTIAYKNIGKILKVLVIFIWGGALSAFFTIPAFFERSLVTISSLTTGYNNYQLHFASLKQLFFDRFWGYGPSVWGPNDQLSFQLGIPYWFLSVAAIIWLAVLLYRRKGKFLLPLLLGVGLFGISTFLTHSRSIFIWKAVPILAYMQFPWRFLALSMLGSSFLGGLLVGVKKWGKIIGIFSVALAIVLNFSYFKPEKFYPEITDAEKLSGEQWQNQSMAAILDYLPKDVQKVPVSLAPDRPEIISGEADVTKLDKRSDLWHFDSDVYQDDTLIRIPVFDFPEWRIIVDGRQYTYSVSKPEGLLQVELNEGKHIVVGWFENTPLRLLANSLSLVAFAALFFYLVISYSHEQKSP
jgi:hypothetical protein